MMEWETTVFSSRLPALTSEDMAMNEVTIPEE